MESRATRTLVTFPEYSGLQDSDELPVAGEYGLIFDEALLLAMLMLMPMSLHQAEARLTGTRPLRKDQT
ncbi:hypothetical protein [Rhabdonatronobacter sediminivivens]|uniref:hypothetical protein n=1 Tax=Rhabdonatronobacter sediminivivens TaxID=2743469 RepID=UPI0015D05875|nr:hypothetical protein [Rhabdonatronobacter sediminivivens]